MALQSAVSAKTASDSANIKTRAVLTSPTMIAIDAKITVESTRIDKDEPTYKLDIEFPGDVNGRTKPVEIIEDGGRILLIDIENALIAEGYRVSAKGVKTRDGKADKIKIQVAWD